MKPLSTVFLLLVACIAPGELEGLNSGEFVISMPNVSPQKKEAYMCTHKKIPIKRGFITSFEALATQSVAHHILLYGCDALANNKKSWDCKETALCDGKEHILFAWAKNAPPLKLPPGVGFYIGSHTRIKHLVLQVHYAKQFKVGQTDQSGLKLQLLTKKLPFAAGIFDFAADYAKIPPGAIGYHSDIVCRYKNEATIVPFAYRVHTHTLGRVVSSYRVRDGTWTLIGQGNPQEPQAFYAIDVMNRARIIHGDGLAARCTFDAPNRTTVTTIGSTSHDEMCNFYIMYYIPFDESLSRHNSQSGCYRSAHKKYKFPAGSDRKLSLHWYLRDISSASQDTVSMESNTEPNKASPVIDSDDTMPSLESDNMNKRTPSLTSLLLVCATVFIPAGFIAAILIYQGVHSRKVKRSLIVSDIAKAYERRVAKGLSGNQENTGLLSSAGESDIDEESQISV